MSAVNNIDLGAIGEILVDLGIPLTPYHSTAELREGLKASAARATAVREKELAESDWIERELRFLKESQRQEIDGDAAAPDSSSQPGGEDRGGPPTGGAEE